MHRGTSTPMFITALSTIVKLWKEPKCPSTDKWMKKMWFIYTMEYYLAVRMNEILPFAATWMELEAFMLNEISQRKTDIICFHSNVDREKLNRRPRGKEGGKIDTIREGGEANHKRLLNTENKLKVDSEVGREEEGKWVMGIEEATCWDEHWVLYASQFDNKLYFKN